MLEPIDVSMHDGAWVFTKGPERLTLSRRAVDDGYLLSVDGANNPRSFFFADLSLLIQFQSDMETFLITTGWSFEEFAPDRRTGRDRRGWPRVENDRRRWWTDGHPQRRASDSGV